MPRRTASIFLRRVRSPILDGTNKIALPPFYMKIVAGDEFNDCATALARASALCAFTRSDLSSGRTRSPVQVALIVATRAIFPPSRSQFSRRKSVRARLLARSDRGMGRSLNIVAYKTTLRRLVTRNGWSRIVNVYNVFNGLQ